MSKFEFAVGILFDAEAIRKDRILVKKGLENSGNNCARFEISAKELERAVARRAHNTINNQKKHI